MMSQKGISGALRRTLLLKVISKPQPTREDVSSVIELASSKVVETLMAQSLTFYLLEGNDITFRFVYYSPTLWSKEPDKEKLFKDKRDLLFKMRLPAGTGEVGKVISTGQASFFNRAQAGDQLHSLSRETGFEVNAMLTVPLKVGGRTIGAIQILNREPDAPTHEFHIEDLAIIEEVAEYSAPLIQRTLDTNFRISDQDTAKFIARYTDSELVLTDELLDLDDNLVEAVGDSVIRRDGVFPLKRNSPNSIHALMTNPLDYLKRESFETATELHLDEIKVAPQSLMDKLLKRFFKDSGKDDSSSLQPVGSEISELADVLGFEFDKNNGDNASLEVNEGAEESAPIIQLANRIIEDAYISGASDIHVEPQENDLLVRYRIDGVCHEKIKLPKAVAGPLVARLKVMSDLDIAEKRLPQDGRIIFKKFTRKNIDIDLRVAVGPMNFGEKIVMRILDKRKSALPITALGFSEENLKIYRDCIRQPYGMILHCGPTGSGKSMTLFSALREVANPDINIQTAEDPIEYTIPGINQMQMHKSIGLTFASALRCYLRMDPDIILVGEIRDQETAEISVEAALTGHLLLSTLHTNDAPSTIARFTDMEIEPFMISASLLVVCAQRLMRRICKQCRQAYVPEGNEKEILERAIGWTGEIYKAPEQGCPACGGMGYKGRIGIHELMRNNEELTRAINNSAETAELKRIAMRNGMKSLHQDSMLKVKEGVTTMMEAISSVPPDMIRVE